MKQNIWEWYKKNRFNYDSATESDDVTLIAYQKPSSRVSNRKINLQITDRVNLLLRYDTSYNGGKGTIEG